MAPALLDAASESDAASSSNSEEDDEGVVAAAANVSSISRLENKLKDAWAAFIRARSTATRPSSWSFAERALQAVVVASEALATHAGIVGAHAIASRWDAVASRLEAAKAKKEAMEALPAHDSERPVVTKREGMLPHCCPTGPPSLGPGPPPWLTPETLSLSKAHSCNSLPLGSLIAGSLQTASTVYNRWYDSPTSRNSGHPRI